MRVGHAPLVMETVLQGRGTAERAGSGMTVMALPFFRLSGRTDVLLHEPLKDVQGDGPVP
jgi:hypothetical protein